MNSDCYRQLNDARVDERDSSEIARHNWLDGQFSHAVVVGALLRL
jgi:hypothetical protein